MSELDRSFKTELKRSPFKEALTFYPANGAPERTVTALVETIASLPHDEGGTSELQELSVTVFNDPADPDVGGIASPALGDRIKRPVGEFYYGFTGKVLAQTAYSWRLLFVGERLREVGSH